MYDGEARVSALIAEFGSASADVPWLLCDRHPPDAVAFTVMAEDLSVYQLCFGELQARSARCAAALAGLGVRAGDRVATLMGKSVDLVAVMLGIWRLGAVYVPLFTAFGPQAIVSRLDASGAKLIIADPGQWAKLRPGPDVPLKRSWLAVLAGGEAGHGELDLTALMHDADSTRLPDTPRGGNRPLVHMFTSGTTGAAKGVVHPVAHIAGWQSYLEHGLGVTNDDIYWCAADPGWAYGLYSAIVAPMAAGQSSVLLCGGFTAETTWSVLANLAVTNFAAAPTAYRALRAVGDPPGGVRLRCASSAGEPLTPEVNDWAQHAFGVPVHDHYGQTELGMVMANCHHPAFARPMAPGSMGRPLPGWRLAVLDVNHDKQVRSGELGRVAVDVSRSALLTFEGYVGSDDNAEKFTAWRTWYLTGDLGSQNPDGDYFFVSRQDDVILMAGYRIGPFDIETVLLQHPLVVECAVVGAPDESRGEVVEAYVVPAHGVVGTAELVAELQDWVKKRYAAHAYPRAVHFIDALPKTPNGKVQRSLLRNRRKLDV